MADKEATLSYEAWVRWIDGRWSRIAAGDSSQTFASRDEAEALAGAFAEDPRATRAIVVQRTLVSDINCAGSLPKKIKRAVGESPPGS